MRAVRISLNGPAAPLDHPRRKESAQVVPNRRSDRLCGGTGSRRMPSWRPMSVEALLANPPAAPDERLTPGSLKAAAASTQEGSRCEGRKEQHGWRRRHSPMYWKRSRR